MRIARPRPTLIAADFLGEDAESLTDRQSTEVTLELANMICGAVLSRIESRATFPPGTPQIVPRTVPARNWPRAAGGDPVHGRNRQRCADGGHPDGNTDMPANRRIRVLIVDDSAIVRRSSPKPCPARAISR
jgi:hypothetical protein